MTSLIEIEAAIEDLPASDVERLAAWLEERRQPKATPRGASTPDFLARAQAVWGTSPEGSSLSQIVAENRG